MNIEHFVGYRAVFFYEFSIRMDQIFDFVLVSGIRPVIKFGYSVSDQIFGPKSVIRSTDIRYLTFIQSVI